MTNLRLVPFIHIPNKEMKYNCKSAAPKSCSGANLILMDLTE